MPLDDGDDGSTGARGAAAAACGTRRCACCSASSTRTTNGALGTAPWRRPGVTVSLSCDVLPEFREYERASRRRRSTHRYGRRWRQYLRSAESGESGDESLGVGESQERRIGTSVCAQHPTPDARLSTLPADHAFRRRHVVRAPTPRRQAAKLVLSGPAGGVIGAAFVASAAAGFPRRHHVRHGWDQHRCGAGAERPAAVVERAESLTDCRSGYRRLTSTPWGRGAGRIAVDRRRAGRCAWGHDRRGQCRGRRATGAGGHDATVTDANVVLGRILADQFFGRGDDDRDRPGGAGGAAVGGADGASR